MRKVLIVGCFLAFVIAGCAPRVVISAAAPPTREPRALPTPHIELVQNPPPCGEADLIYHTRFKQMLLVNCVGDPATMTLLTIWNWDGTQWHRVTQEGPPARTLGGAAYDDLRDVLVEARVEILGPELGRHRGVRVGRDDDQAVHGVFPLCGRHALPWRVNPM